MRKKERSIRVEILNHEHSVFTSKLDKFLEEIENMILMGDGQPAVGSGRNGNSVAGGFCGDSPPSGGDEGDQGDEGPQVSK